MYNFPPNNWEVRSKASRLVNLTWSQEGSWRSVTLGELAFGEMRGFTWNDIPSFVPIDALPLFSLASSPFPDRSFSLPKVERDTTMPSWRASLSLLSSLSSTSYQGELDPFPVPGSLITFSPFIQFGLEIENYLLILNLEKNPQTRTSTFEIFDSALPTSILGTFEVRNNSITSVCLDNYGFEPEVLPVIISKGMSGIPLYFSRTSDGSCMSLEHTHPPASYVIHGKRWEAQRIIKKYWFSLLEQL